MITIIAVTMFKCFIANYKDLDIAVTCQSYSVALTDIILGGIKGQE